ncbi:exo-beta-1,3-glucanase [Crepidotus variabilis]|uniref:Exo-beta-1,3-glucanase n=1 Tax=Crepidotus variabilis TaxID=179855 RepID=A0A9P6JT18_9AGAR|nr:exo-beta-1,3-glucanase [Crepidotus variabilis]
MFSAPLDCLIPSRQHFSRLAWPGKRKLLFIVGALILLLLTTLLCLFCIPRAVPAVPSVVPFNYGVNMVRGVNLGGWLVVEPWLAQSVFMTLNDTRIFDEWTFCLYQDHDTATTILEQHWETFITEEDFREIAAAGLNHVRIPIPYYAFDVQPGEPYIQGQLEYLDKAVQWASKYNLKIIIDLHAAPGSQNSFDNSGHITTDPEWANNTNYVRRTTDIVRTIAQKYQNSSKIVPMLEPLNEPAGFLGAPVLDIVKPFYYESYNATRWPFGDSGPANKSDIIVLLSDAFQSSIYWRGFMPYPEWEGVMVDRHVYQIYSDPEITRSWDEHIQFACHNSTQDFANSTLWQITGEWALATTDCSVSPHIYPRGLGSRYDGTKNHTVPLGNCAGLSGDATSFNQDYKVFLRKYWEAQVTAFERESQGWTMWTWKAENADDWSYQAGLKNGWIPWNITERMYPGLCEETTL